MSWPAGHLDGINVPRSRVTKTSVFEALVV
jgi:hypothetical protein